jgi:DNA-binding CsgD family transcriptional regulator
MVRGDSAAAVSSVELTRQRGDLPRQVLTCVVMGLVDRDPEPWLRQAYAAATRLDSPFLQTRVGGLLRGWGVAVPRTRQTREGLSAMETRIVELMRGGRTNRQIAMRLSVSEKTVEYHLTKLFARTGHRSRVELVTASLSGQLFDLAS